MVDVLLVIIGILIYTFAYAVQDNISSYDTFSIWLIKKQANSKTVFWHKFYGHIIYWFRDEGWENKYQLKEWLIKVLNISSKIANKLAADVFVIITDAWHFFKFIGTYFILLPSTAKILISFNLSINLWVANIAIAIIQGTLFNILFYSLSKLKNNNGN